MKKGINSQPATSNRPWKRCLKDFLSWVTICMYVGLWKEKREERKRTVTRGQIDV